MDEFVWLRFPATGGTWRCPVTAANEWREMGWEPCDPPAEVNPATVERVGWDEIPQQAEPAEPAVEPEQTQTPEPVEPARTKEK